VAEPSEDDVERYEAYWDGFADGMEHMQKESAMKVSQTLLAIKRLGSINDVRRKVDLILNEMTL
jgi:hypothetical protein